MLLQGEDGHEEYADHFDRIAGRDSMGGELWRGKRDDRGPL